MSARLPLSRRAAVQQALTLAGGAIAGSALAPSAAVAAAVPRDLPDDRAQQPVDVQAWLSQTGVPSVALARVEGERITTEVVGVKRAGTTDAAAADTVYAAASLTKMLVAYVALDLVVGGTLSLDQPLRDIVPLPNPDDPRAGGITARRLLSHTSGWPNWRNAPAPPMTAAFEPGSRWQYSGEGFFYLARVLEALTNTPFPRLMRERLFTPLGMSRSSVVPLPTLEPHRATPHDGRGNPMVPYGGDLTGALSRRMEAAGRTLEDARVVDVEEAFRALDPARFPLPNFLTPNAAASLLTTVEDFARFVRHVATAGRAGGRRAAIVQLLMQPQVRCNAAVQWGLGVGLERIGARDHAWQWGDNPGFKNYCAIDPQGGTGFVVFTNGDRGARVYERLVRARTGADRPGFLWL